MSNIRYSEKDKKAFCSSILKAKAAVLAVLSKVAQILLNEMDLSS